VAVVASRSGTEDNGHRRSAEWQQRDLVWRSALSRTQKLTLLAFLDCDRLAQGKELYPSLRRVAWQTNQAYSTVRHAVEGLERLGVLSPVGTIPSRYRLRGRVTRYLFHGKRLPHRPDYDAKQGVESDRCQPPARVEGLV
jgi:hypothetical protein